MAEHSKESGSQVNEEKAKEHIKFAIMKNWIGKVSGFENWHNVKLEEKPLIIHDLNGQNLFYEYQVKLENDIVGMVKASASKVLGSPVPQIQLGPRRWNPDQAIINAKEAVKKLYPNAKVSRLEFVCYSYPKIGVRVHLDDSKGELRSLIFDVASTRLVDRFGADELPGFASWSFYDEIIEEASKRVARWDAMDEELDIVRGKIPRLLGPGINSGERESIGDLYIKLSIYDIISVPFISSKIVQYCQHCSTHNCNSLHAQHTDVYCACATGQMILDFYRYYYSQDECAIAMGTGPFGTYISGMLDGLESLSKNCLEAELDGSATWSEAKSEIDANRPLASLIPNHARACFGWKRQNIYLVSSTPARWLYILDPWPWNADICSGGAVYWEDWSAVNHTYFIYVRHRSTSCA